MAVETRVRVEIHHDQSAENPVDQRDGFGTLIRYDQYGPTIHEQMRGEPCAVRVDLPTSYSDRGQRPAIMVLSPAKVRESYGADNAETREKARASLAAEATEYQAWADGYSYGFILTYEKRCPQCGAWEATDTGPDSVWGFTTYEEGELLDWMGEHMDDRGKAALVNAIENWTGEYPIAARGES